MNRFDGLWEDVQIGFYVLDMNGKWWKVVDLLFAGRWVLEDADGIKTKIPVPAGHRPVTYMYDLKTLVQQKLDGKEIQ